MNNIKISKKVLNRLNGAILVMQCDYNKKITQSKAIEILLYETNN